MTRDAETRSRVLSAEARLAYADLPSAVRFLTDAFGLKERVADRLLDDDGGFTATWLDVGDSTLMAGRSGDHGLVSPKTAGPTAMIIVTVVGIDAHYDHAVEVGAQIIESLHDVPWGFRRYEAADTEGHRWHFMEALTR